MMNSGSEAQIENEGDDDFRDDIERMAEARAEIERGLERRKEELAQIGEFAQARCTEFSRSVNSDGDITHVIFSFEFPDGTTAQKSFRLDAETESLDSFLESYGADSLTDMVGSKHTCYFTDSGWKLHRRRKARPGAYYQYVAENGDLFQIHWPTVVGYLGVMLGSLLLSSTENSNVGFDNWMTFGAFIIVSVGTAVGMFAAIAILDGHIGWDR